MAKANKNAVKNEIHLLNAANDRCIHGQELLPDVCIPFITYFFHSYLESIPITQSLVCSVNKALLEACTKYPEAVTNKDHLDVLKKSIVSNGVSYLLGQSYSPSNSNMPVACAVALMMTDFHVPSSPLTPGNFVHRDANTFLRNSDIIWLPTLVN